MEDFFAGWGRWLAVAEVFALGLAGVNANAADAKWQERSDRYEGIRAENVSGGSFKLLGVHIEPSLRTQGAARIYCSVPLREAAELRIQVWDPESGYAMVPKRKTFRPGEFFFWHRAEVLAPQEIDTDQLYILATDPLNTLYYPARITTAEPRLSEGKRYVFLFRSRGGVDLEVTIAREKEGRLVDVWTGHRDEKFGGLLDFVWDGRNAAGLTALAGTYHLKLEGTVFLKSDLPVVVDIPFVHHGEMSP